MGALASLLTGKGWGGGEGNLFDAPSNNFHLRPVSHGGDDFETVIYLSHQEKTNVRGDLGTLEIYHNGPVKIRPDHLFLAFTAIENL